MKKISFTLAFALLTMVLMSQDNNAPSTPGIREYDFQNTLNEKHLNQPSLTPLDVTGIYVLDTLNEINNKTRIVYRFEKNSGLQFENTLAGNFLGQSYTIELYFVFDELDSWKRVIDWKSRSTDHGAYIYYGELNFYPYIYSDTAYVSPGEYTYYVLTRDSASMKVVIYTDAKEGVSFTDSYGDALLDGNNVLNFFQDDLEVVNEASSGAVSLLNIYNYVLDTSEIRKHFQNLQGQIFSTNDLSGEKFMRIFPNPATGIITVEMKELAGYTQLTIMNLNGKEIISRQVTGPKSTIDISVLTAGIYFVKLTNDRSVQVGKFIKQ